MTSAATVTATVGLLTSATSAALRADGDRVQRAVEDLTRVPFDLVSVTAALMLARSVAGNPGALLLGVQAESAPATTNLRRTAGQLFLLAADHFARGEPADAPLAGLQAMSRHTDPAQLLHGAVWALTLLQRCAVPDRTVPR